MTMRMGQKPQSIDTVIGTDLHIDTISDLAAALAGSIGIAASANLDHLTSWAEVLQTRSVRYGQPQKCWRGLASVPLRTRSCQLLLKSARKAKLPKTWVAVKHYEGCERHVLGIIRI